MDVSVPLDEVMLAMDVVDTLRHQRAQVAAELDEDKREAQLIARVHSIYESQGMDVPSDVIAEGVKALVEDRFKYDPPARSFAVRLAEIYVERGKWAFRMFVVVLLAAAVWAVFAIPAHFARERMVDEFRSQLTSLGQRAELLQRRAGSLDRQVASFEAPSASAFVTSNLGDAKRRLTEAKTELTRVRSQIDPGPDPVAYLAAKEQLDGELATRDTELGDVGTGLDEVTGKLELLRGLAELRAKCETVLVRLQGIPVPEDERSDLEARRAALLVVVDDGKLAEGRGELRALDSVVLGIVRARQERQNNNRELLRLTSRIKGMKPDAATKAELDGLAAGAKGAIDADDDVAASSNLSRLSSLIALLSTNYELRIVTGRGQRSGVWRNTPGRKRNYYIIVEAIDAGGRRLRLPIKNEENNRTDRVSSFGVRVPKNVYDQVGADKKDNGIIENRLFGVKGRGAREVEYRFPVSGGMITRW